MVGLSKGPCSHAGGSNVAAMQEGSTHMGLLLLLDGGTTSTSLVLGVLV